MSFNTTFLYWFDASKIKTIGKECFSLIQSLKVGADVIKEKSGEIIDNLEDHRTEYP